MARSVVLTLDVSEPRVGVWCESCALPSAIEVDIVRMSSAGVSLLSTVQRCANGPHGQEVSADGS